MTSADVALPVDPEPIIWITGLSGTGKSTLARAVVDALRAEGTRALLLDGDSLRAMLEEPGEAMRHDRTRRLARAERIAVLARLAAAQGIPVVVATISLFHVVQGSNRARAPRYAEVLLTAEIEALRRRDPDLYGAGDGPAQPDVVGVDIAPEFPVNAELVIAQRFLNEDLLDHVAQVVMLFRTLSSRGESGGR